MTKIAKLMGGANGRVGTVSVESVADILERELQTVIKEWLMRVEKEPDLAHIPLNYEEAPAIFLTFCTMSLDAYAWTQGRKPLFRRLRPNMGICDVSKAIR